jgi:hypothetical protein
MIDTATLSTGVVLPLPSDALRCHECRPSRAAMAWLRSLPEPLQPVRLVREHARVANLLCHRWDDRELALRFVKELLNDHRGGQNGFALAVANELRALAYSLQSQRPRHH